MRIAIGIATIGRAVVLREVLGELHRQQRPPDRVIICHTKPADVAECEAVWPGSEFLLSPPGLPLQRNAILAAAADCDVVLFLDDDFLPQPGYLAALEAAFAADPALVVATGAVIADGAKGPGLTVAEGRGIMALDHPPADTAPVPHFNGYGCNMAVRMAVVRATGNRVGESRPREAWYEDLDFTRLLGRHGAIRRLPAARGVHLGVKFGRGSGVRLGYSQIANPVYLARKGTYPWDRALGSMARNLAMNLLRSLSPEPWVDRRGRLRGNLMALADLLRGRAHPMRVLEI
jgi:glycosyltransferase involved in cell wall biosynthesis